MKEVILTGLYWLANLLILLAALTYALKLWGNQYRMPIALCLFFGGILWHVLRAVYTYNQDACESIAAADSLLRIANKCIPPLADDIIWAQIALFVGLFVIIAELAKFYAKRKR